MNFTGKTIWITGATSGIGKAMALQLSKHQCKLIISGRDASSLEETSTQCIAEGSQVQTVAFDLGTIDSVDKAIQEVLATNESIHGLYLVGGLSQRSLIAETPIQNDRKLMEVNFFANVALSKAVLPLMLRNGGGQIAVTSSIVGKFGFPYRSTYAASKHALHGFFESLRLEHLDDHIKVSLIILGRVQTNISLKAINASGESYGKMDDGQAGGIPAEEAARKILQGLKKEKKEILVGGKELLMVHIRRFFPGIFYKLAAKVKPT